MQYARADYQTLSRRSAEEKSKASEFAITKFAASLLSTADVLTTALKHVKTPIDPTNKSLLDLYSGVELTHKALLKTFEQHGVKPFENTAGEPFNPNFHEATFQIPKEVAPKKADGSFHAPGDVVEVAKDGWMIKDRVLRPAQVGVVQIE
ncbi:molecular chaperone GrpE, partial [Tremellales sp. Uapishka_1]